MAPQKSLLQLVLNFSYKDELTAEVFDFTRLSIITVEIN